MLNSVQLYFAHRVTLIHSHAEKPSSCRPPTQHLAKAACILFGESASVDQSWCYHQKMNIYQKLIAKLDNPINRRATRKSKKLDDTLKETVARECGGPQVTSLYFAQSFGNYEQSLWQNEEPRNDLPSYWNSHFKIKPFLIFNTLGIIDLGLKEFSNIESKNRSSKEKICQIITNKEYSMQT